MSETITTSIRLSPKLRQALERRARQEKRGKNWIISRALENYLEHDEVETLTAEAKRQSMIAAQQDTDEWSLAADLDQWR